jgi:transcriptional regulator with XRE-family HTH domain
MENRKRLNLTQDALAEQLGVTAQAVSKWENDLSCPDITMLPKLADIFHISTDELLGRPVTPVHTAEVVDADEPEGIHIQNGSWEFKWDSGRREAMTFAVLVLLVGVLTLCSKLLSWGASFWEILWPSTLLVYGARGLLRRFSFFSAGCSLFGAYFLVDNLNIWQLDIAGELIFPIIIVLFGISLLVDALRKPNKPRFSIHKNGDIKGKTVDEFHVDAETFECSLSFGESTRCIELPRLLEGTANVSFGELTVDLSGCGEIVDGCEIEANCSFGQLNLLVPSRYRVKTDASTAFGAIDIQGQPDADPIGTICVDGNASFGELEIRYI